MTIRNAWRLSTNAIDALTVYFVLSPEYVVVSRTLPASVARALPKDVLLNITGARFDAVALEPLGIVRVRIISSICC